RFSRDWSSDVCSSDLGIEFVSEAQPLRIVRADASVLKVVSAAGEHQGFDTLIWAVGRQPNTAGMGLSELSVDLDEAGHVKVDEWIGRASGRERGDDVG